MFKIKTMKIETSEFFVALCDLLLKTSVIPHVYSYFIWEIQNGRSVTGVCWLVEEKPGQDRYRLIDYS